MKIKIFRHLFLLCVALSAAVGMTSCGNDEPYWTSNLTGSWTLASIDGRPVVEAEVCEFTFYGDGTGAYGQYNPYPHWSVSPIDWEVDYASGGAEYLYIYTYGDVWSYLVRLYRDGGGDYMELTDLDTGQRLLFYDGY